MASKQEQPALPRVVIRVKDGEHAGTYVSDITGFPLPMLHGKKWFLHAEVGAAYQFFLPAAHEMLAHLANAELLPPPVPGK